MRRSIAWRAASWPMTGRSWLASSGTTSKRSAMPSTMGSSPRATAATLKAFAMMEGGNWAGGASIRYRMDHAGAWKTSVMLSAHGGRVSLDALREQMEAAGRTDVEAM